MRVFFTNFTGANCTLGGQTIISLNVTEDAEADYDTASAVCLAPDGPWPKGTTVQTIEGGTATGWWEVDNPVISESGSKTWRKKQGGPGAHIGLVAYRLRRKGWMKGRATISRTLLGRDKYPLKFCSRERYTQMNNELSNAWQNKEISIFEKIRIMESWHPVYGPADIAYYVTNLVGLPVAMGVKLEHMPPEYIPVGKSIMTICREVASWSAASVYLDRNGILNFFDWQEAFNRSNNREPGLPLYTEIDYNNGMSPCNEVTVIGSGRVRTTHTIPAQPDRPDPIHPGNIWPGHPEITYVRYGNVKAVEVTEYIDRVSGEYPVEERIEIRDYELTPTLASKIARERLCKAALQSMLIRWHGPAQGAGGLHPLMNSIYSVNRQLEWTGTGYRYEADIMTPWGVVPFPGGTSPGGWW